MLHSSTQSPYLFTVYVQPVQVGQVYSFNSVLKKLFRLACMFLLRGHITNSDVGDCF